MIRLFLKCSKCLKTFEAYSEESDASLEIDFEKNIVSFMCPDCNVLNSTKIGESFRGRNLPGIGGSRY